MVRLGHKPHQAVSHLAGPLFYVVFHARVLFPVLPWWQSQRVSWPFVGMLSGHIRFTLCPSVLRYHNKVPEAG